MKQQRFSTEQIVSVLKLAELGLPGGGFDLPDRDNRPPRVIPRQHRRCPLHVTISRAREAASAYTDSRAALVHAITGRDGSQVDAIDEAMQREGLASHSSGTDVLRISSKSLIWIYGRPRHLPMTGRGLQAMTFHYVHGRQDEITGFLADTLRRRRLRSEYLSPDLLSDPAWDMMLDLTLNERRGQEVVVTSLCLASCVPATTALRWITKLEDQGLIRREPSPEDRRSSRMFLTDQGRAAMEGWARRAMHPPARAESDVFGKVLV